MPKFCGNCGSMIDETTNLCPVCDVEEKTVAVEAVSQPVAMRNDYPQQSYQQQTAQVYTEPAVAAPQQNFIEEPNKKAKKQKKTKPAKQKKANKDSNKSGLTVFLTILLTICLFITSILAVVIYDIRNAVKKGNCEDLFDNIDVVSALENSNTKAAKNLDKFYGFLYEGYDIDMTDKKLEEFIEDSTVKRYAANKVSYFAKELFKGDKAKIEIRVSEIVELLEDNEDLIDDEFDVYLTYDEMYEIAEWILPDGDVEVINTKSIPTLATVLRFSLSYFAIIFFALLSALFIFMMIKNNLLQALLGTGINFITIGALTGIVYIITLITPLWETIASASIILTIIGNMFAINAIFSAILFGVGVLLLVARKVTLVILSKKSKA